MSTHELIRHRLIQTTAVTILLHFEMINMHAIAESKLAPPITAPLMKMLRLKLSINRTGPKYRKLFVASRRQANIVIYLNDLNENRLMKLWFLVFSFFTYSSLKYSFISAISFESSYTSLIELSEAILLKFKTAS